AAGLVVLHHDQAAVVRDRATDCVARLNHTFGDLALEEVHLGQTAIAAEDEGVSTVAREPHGSMRKVAQPANGLEHAATGRLDDLDIAVGALDDDAEVTRSAQRSGRRSRTG